MSDESWYRNTNWTAQIAAVFDVRLARSRGQKAQYLRIQGSMLKETHPTAALDLLARCIALGDDYHIAHAHLDAAHAHVMLGDITGALQSLEAAIEQEARFPMCRTSAPFDYCMLVALHDREERFDVALAILDRLGPGIFAAHDFQADSARALILWARGRKAEARQAAERALAAATVEAEWIPGHPDVGVVPGLDNELGRRVVAIASGAG